MGLAYVVAVNSLTIGELSAPSSWHLRPRGKPISANYKARLIGAIRAVLRDAQEWGWCTRRLDAYRVFAISRSIKARFGHSHASSPMTSGPSSSGQVSTSTPRISRSTGGIR